MNEHLESFVFRERLYGVRCVSFCAIMGRSLLSCTAWQGSALPKCIQTKTLPPTEQIQTRLPIPSEGQCGILTLQHLDPESLRLQWKEALSAVINTAPAPELSWRGSRCMGEAIPPHSVSSRGTGVATAIPPSGMASAVPCFCLATTPMGFLAFFFIPLKGILIWSGETKVPQAYCSVGLDRLV